MALLSSHAAQRGKYCQLSRAQIKGTRVTRLSGARKPTCAIAQAVAVGIGAKLASTAAPPANMTDGAHTATTTMHQPTDNPSATALGESTAGPEQQQQPSQPYVWQRNWVPVAPLPTLDPSRPSPVMLLGQPLVVWRHAARGWVVMRDMCPHRLAPLSEGRLEAGGTRIACSYHGWEFNEGGACTKVPQLTNDPRAAATACTSKRSCVTTFPTLELDGVLFTWLDASKEGLAAMEVAPKPPLGLNSDPAGFDWIMNELPADYPFWVEQSMDPTHANYLHQGVGSFQAAHALPLEGPPADKVELQGGFRWRHGAYETRNKGMQAERAFLPPFITKVFYDLPSGSRMMLCTMAVPVRPGVARVYFKAGFGRGAAKQEQQEQQHHSPQVQPPSGSGASPQAASASPAAPGSGQHAVAAPAPAAAGTTTSQAAGESERPRSFLGRLQGVIPHWLFGTQLLADQDVLMMCKQESLMRSTGLTARDYRLNSKADVGVTAVNSWLRKAGYPESLWGRQPAVQTGPTYSSWPAQELSLEQILSRQERHVRHCAVCQRGMKLVTAVCTALTAAAGLAAVAAVALAVVAATRPEGVAAVGGWGPLAGALAGCLGLVAAAVQGWSFREERFVSGAPQWRRKGGFAGFANNPATL